jgi:predicted DNA binding CopG/RHH family protein
MKSKRVPIEDIQDLGDVEYDAAFTAKVEAATAQAEADVSARKTVEVHVHFRWDSQHLNVVRKAAELLGVPYQAYIKDCIFRQALRDIDMTTRVLYEHNHPR